MVQVVRKIYNPSIIIDNLVVAYVPNSLSFTEGLGEQKLTVQTGGGGSVQQVLSDDITKKQSTVKFKLLPTADNIAFMRALKADLGGHVITLSETGSDFSRTIVNAILINNYELQLGSDSEFEVEFHGSSSI